ncbi:hypothetical protein [Lactococcus lactis]|uniref:hypothetical protein n=1 Tax=Lactococcus lactis TaxID=1358 RepID=UPI00207D566F|nr:hypothetical protein [Lactococcus lactis]
MLKRFIHHPETIGLVIMATMVFFMSNYNMLWRFGIYNYSVKKELFIFPVIFVAVYIVKKIFSVPVVRLLHNKSQWLSNISKDISFPLLVIIFNSTIIMAISTYLTHNYIENHFFISYLINWSRSAIVAIPLFFFVVQPLIHRLFNWLKSHHKFQ